MADHTAPVTGLSREPAAVIGFITALVAAIIGVAVAFGLDLTDDQRNSILILTAVLAPVIAALLTRPRVSPANTVVAQSTPTGAVVAGQASPLPTGSGVTVHTDPGTPL